MTKNLVNLIGAVATAAILVLGVVVFALPVFSGANATLSDADAVASQNGVQQAVLDSLTAQAADITAIEAEVAGLRAGITETAQVEDLLEIAARAADAHGGRLRTITPADAAAFAPRTAEVVAVALGQTAPVAEAPAPAETGAADDGAAEGGSAPETPAPVEAGTGPQQIEVTVEIDTPDVETATRILDELRSAARLVAITRANVLTEEETVTLTATVLVFFRP